MKKGRWFNRASRFSADDSGAVLVEFTLIFPLLLIMTFGAVQYGMLFLTYNGMLNAARETARLWSVGQLATDAAARTDIAGRRAGAAGWVEAGDWNVGGTSKSGDQLTVSVVVPSKRASVITMPFLPMPGNISATVVMKQE